MYFSKLYFLQEFVSFFEFFVGLIRKSYDEIGGYAYVRSNITNLFYIVKIQDGCDNFCAYCIIPYLRGNIRNKDIDIAEKEIECLVVLRADLIMCLLFASLWLVTEQVLMTTMSASFPSLDSMYPLSSNFTKRVRHKS